MPQMGAAGSANSLDRAVHEVAAATTVDVNVDQTGREQRVLEINDLDRLWQSPPVGFDRGDSAVFNNQTAIVHDPIAENQASATKTDGRGHSCCRFFPVTVQPFQEIVYGI